MSVQVVDCGQFWAQDVDNTNVLNNIQMHLQEYVSHVQRSVCSTLTYSSIIKLKNCIVTILLLHFRNIFISNKN